MSYDYVMNIKYAMRMLRQQIKSVEGWSAWTSPLVS